MRIPSWLKGIWSGFLQTISVWFVVLGLAFMVSAYKKVFSESETFNNFLASLGNAILVGGVFAVILKSFQFLGIFREELNKILFDEDDLANQKRLRQVISEETHRTICGALYDAEDHSQTPPPLRLRQVFRDELVDSVYSPTLLARQRDIEEIWRKVSKVLYQSKFPEISDQIEDTVLQTYFPTNINYYYESVLQDIAFTAHQTDSEYFTVIERYTFTVRSVDASEIVIPYRLEILRKDSADPTDYELSRIRINGEDKTSEMNSKLIKSAVEPKLLRVNLEILLEGKKEYQVVIEQKKTYGPFLDNTNSFSSSKFINGLELDIRHPPELSMRFFPMGTPRDFSDEVITDSRIWKTYKGLIFPQQGYRILMFRK